MKALVVNCGRNGLGVIRSLGSKGVTVIAVDHSRFSPALYSRYVSKRYTVTAPTQDPKHFIQHLIDIGQAECGDDKSFLLPMNDEYVALFAEYWSELEPWFYPVFETDRAILEMCMTKTSMYKAAHAAGVPYPRTAYSPFDYKASDFSFPLIVKPHNRRAIESIQNQVFRIRYCENLTELSQALKELEDKGEGYVVQEYIPGDDDELYTAGIFAYKGKLAATFTGRKLRQFPIRTGECAFGEIVNEPSIIDYARQFVAYTKFTGIAQVEFKHYDGEFYLMEINPRSWSWNSLSTFSGTNLPWIGCQTVQQGGVSLEQTQTRFQGTWCYSPLDLWHSVFLNHTISLSRALKQIASADCYAYWQSDDPIPGVLYGLKSSMQTLTGLAKRV